MQNQDLINSPSHYKSDPSGIECIEITQEMPFCLGNCYKYIHRAPFKGSMLQDLQKARYYAKRAGQLGQTITPAQKSLIQTVASFQTNDRKPLFEAFAGCDQENGLSDVISLLDNQIAKFESDRIAALESKAGIDWLFKDGVSMPSYRRLFAYKPFYHNEDKTIWSNGMFHIVDTVTDELIDEYLHNNFMRSSPQVLSDSTFKIENVNNLEKVVVINRNRGYMGVIWSSLIELSDGVNSYHVEEINLQLFLAKFGKNLNFYKIKHKPIVAVYVDDKYAGELSLIDNKTVVGSF